MWFLTTALLSILPAEGVAIDRCERIELNHFYDGDAQPIFDQVIFWDQNVVAWRLWKSEAQTPRRDWRHGGYMTIWNDGDRLRVVRAGSFSETWTQYDPELEDRESLPHHLRRHLSGETPIPRPLVAAP